LENLKKLGYELQVGYEIEFVILDKETLKPVENNGAYNLNSLYKFGNDLINISNSLNGRQIKVEHIHKEISPG
jgi:glutamine synthetase